jgi:sterol desaturase/sphingolipid hydroxylase (fatty acid hydroxylase superfamily)
MHHSIPLLTLLRHASEWLELYLVLLIVISICAAIESAVPVERLQSKAATRLNLLYMAAYSMVTDAIQPLTASCSVWIVSRLGGGLVTLRSDGWGTVASFIVVLLTVDLLEYGFHRLQHTIPFLWRMHALHHSAQSYNVTLTLRHFWFEPLIKGCLVYPIVGVLFKVDPKIVLLTSLVFVPGNYFAHMNLRVTLGRFSTWINNPQYHRLHHSRHPEHFDKNFAQLLPVWDHLFGTIWVPSPHEWPATGLETGAEPKTLAEALTWPWRDHGERAAPVSSVAAPAMSERVRRPDRTVPSNAQ